jgi:hypothetical protein
MPPKDGTPCIAGACRGGFGRADPGQPRCDRPETSTDLERAVVVTRSRRRRAAGVTKDGDSDRAPGRAWRHHALATAIAYLVIPGVTTLPLLVTGKILESCRGVTIGRGKPRRISLCGFRQVVAWKGGRLRRPVAQRPRERATAPWNGHPGFSRTRKMPLSLISEVWRDC